VKRRNLYRETYKAGALTLNADSLPVLKHLGENGKKFEAIGCEVLAAGVVEINNIKLEYQDLRVYVDAKQ
jgi:hypothetical protein